MQIALPTGSEGDGTTRAVKQGERWAAAYRVPVRWTARKHGIRDATLLFIQLELRSRRPPFNSKNNESFVFQFPIQTFHWGQLPQAAPSPVPEHVD